MGGARLADAELDRFVAIDTDHQRWIIEDLRNPDIHRAGNQAHLRGELLRDAKGSRCVASLDLHVDWGGQAEIQDLAGDIRGLCVNRDTGHPLSHSTANPLDIAETRMMAGLELNLQIGVLRSNAVGLIEEQRPVDRQSDMVGHDVEFASRNNLTDDVFDLIELAL